MLAFKLDPAVELALRRQRSVALKEGTFFTTGYGKRHFIFLRALRERWVAIELTASNCALIARCRSGKCSFTALRFDDLDGIEILSSPAGAPTDDVIEDAFNLRAAR
ncbi:MAG: hypothetical protein Q8R16_01300, partial [bacterium]|nr:hypothetical protein [bacterium]